MKKDKKDTRIYIKETFSRTIDGKTDEIMQEGFFEMENGKEVRNEYKAHKRQNNGLWEKVDSYYDELEKLDERASNELLEAKYSDEEERE